MKKKIQFFASLSCYLGVKKLVLCIFILQSKIFPSSFYTGKGLPHKTYCAKSLGIKKLKLSKLSFVNFIENNSCYTRKGFF